MKIAFVFPGQGSQYVGMGKEIFEEYPIVRETFIQASDILGYDIADLCFNGPAEELNKTFKTQPCILTTSIAILRIIEEKGIKPSVVAGHSLGEYSALVAAKVISFDNAVRLTEKRGHLMQEAVPEGKGLMAAILGLDREKVDDICNSVSSGYVAPSNYNCPGQIVIAGEKPAVEEAIELCKKAGAKRAVALSVSAPSHCKLMEQASKKLGELIDEIELKNPFIPIVNNAEAKFLYQSDEIKTSLIRQLNSPLLWEDSIKTITDHGINTFMEIGPGKVLSGLIKRISPESKILNVEDKKTLEIAFSFSVTM